MIIIDYLYNKTSILLRNVKIGKRNKLKGKIIFKGRKGITIGDECVFNSGIRQNPLLGFEHCCLGTSGNGTIVIGNRVGISNSCIYSCNSIVIHDGVKIGNSTTIFDTNFHSINPNDRNNPDEIATGKIEIHENAWIGANCIILKSVTIGKNSILAAGSVLSKSIPDGEIWGGNPAKFIKKIPG